MKKSFILFASLLLLTSIVKAQVGVGTTTPASSAMLDVTSTNKGFLPPKMNYAQRQVMTNPANGLVIFCTDCGPSSVGGELQVYSGGIWRNMIGSAAAGVCPTVAATTAATNITSSTATSGGNITNDGGSAIIARGVCWSTIQNPTTANFKTTNGATTGSFTSNLTGLIRATTYYVRAYATNAGGTDYGPQISFTTLSTPPTVAATIAATSITSTTATSGGNITSDGGSVITARGVCWSTSQNPTTGDSKTTDGTTTGTYTSSLTGLTTGTTYYVRAYATNAVGTNYGTEINFTTLSAPTVAATTAATSITGTTATSGGNITSDGGSAITVRGVCWSTSSTPTIADAKTTDGVTTGSYTSNLTGLTPATTYYVRAYATNTIGTTYGSEISFTTTPPTPPTVAATVAATSITGSTATSGGNITNDGGSTITARGVCWSTSSTPTIADSKTTDVGTTGSYTSNLTGLTPVTTYYVRAYATNTIGTTYGSEISFTTTPPTPPTVAATTMISIFFTTATSGGNITSDGGSAITARGACWSTSQNPTIANSKTIDGGTTGSYTSNLTGLTEGTYYYVRAYATNAVGTAYGQQIIFATQSNTTVLKYIGDNYGGGKVAYILVQGDSGYDANTQHGLIAATTDLGTANWNDAVRMASAYSGGGYNDWRLPTKNELNKLFQNKNSIGGFANSWYWSSTETSGNAASYQHFSNGLNGLQGFWNKITPSGSVRAVRAF